MVHSSPVAATTAPSSAAEGTPTAVLAAQVAALRYDRLSRPARVVATQCILDGVGVAVAATEQPAAQILRKTVLSEVADGPASLLGTGRHTTACEAALVNGTAAHALDYDDVSAPMSGHPTVPVLPTALALGEERDMDGQSLITAIVAGIECEIRVGAALGNAHYRRGFHTTATAGTLGAAAAAANLLSLPPRQTRDALGIAATHAAGLKSMFGTMCKPLHAGKAAAAGMRAAKLAAAGFTTADDGIAGEQGLLAVLSDDANPDALTTPFGQPWHVTNVLFKFHASCYLTHASIEAALQLRAKGLRPHDIESVQVLVTPSHLGVCAIPSPQTGLEGKFSLRFTTALALATGHTDESAFTDAATLAPELVTLRDRIQIVTSDELDRYTSRVTAYDRAGGIWQAHDDVAVPRWANLPDEQARALHAKFDTLLTPVLGKPRTTELRTALENLALLDSVTAVTALTAPEPGSH